ncbi:isopentenyl-diphosphate Delta-isomerase [Elizabethkingia meningoseptica]|uniref:Isopentenyl-diphosphate delta-isomerase n=1 Tax=Elizabethkingia meningoseptica TaxID=238 RepID=A0A1T3ICT1_ELIME|nr:MULTISPECIES: isopentenyl-diphosphate Delta-isomerase [Elizabethkingia]AQX13550.1 isopentenyl-diphosphate delta-isomerase [Elizabethkingia meningoseptica]EJK5327558.1 isopentenyl-diphosphate Delta-isomerase [Elizabethkingia meningoseptica]MBG0515281.1 isopentenyl-diphosphate Delta-isomerase [Elizabethkingia meningoseptica]MDE5429637.1 isopentenyl-diphosphate Delta-isomerase [Elizabethkingia meningoseptica]MDE5434299.1 isopentenyl-diphosphate Delta-isomerase [Elizabethkingia meningoseptica]
MEEKVVLVTPNDEVLGLMEKIQAHKNGLLHRAFSVFLFNNEGKMLLQQRSSNKYHSPDQWTNACCSHPRENETYLDAAMRRVNEELGINCQLEEKFHFIYKADVGQGLWEHELDHVFIGEYNGEYRLNPDEVSAIRFVTLEELDHEVAQQPEMFTEWFKIILKEYRDRL